MILTINRKASLTGGRGLMEIKYKSGLRKTARSFSAKAGMKFSSPSKSSTALMPRQKSWECLTERPGED